MNYILISFLAGILTVFAPCVFTLLPVILGGTLSGSSLRRALVITTSLSVSVIAFTLLLKVSTAFINVPPEVWNVISGGIILVLGVVTIFPELWSRISVKLRLQTSSDQLLQDASQKKTGFVRDILVGAALGPVFSSCSPTYALILATILPQDFAGGLLNLVVYALGMGIMLLLISVLGQKLISRLKWAVNPKGAFRRVLGILFVLIGLMIITGFDRKLQTALLDGGYFDVTKIEIGILQNTPQATNDSSNSIKPTINLNVAKPYPAPDFASANWINSAPLHISDLKGKVVLVDFWTYSCINCIRTLPYIKQWYAKYKDQGLVVIGVHAPEFAFEKVAANVRTFMEANGIEYPVVQDNDLQIWSAYKNQYWPASYFIDRDGNVVNTHFGEGEYDHNEMVIQYLLGQKELSSDLGNVQVPVSPNQSPESYLGYGRGQQFANASEFKADSTVNYSGYSLGLPADYWSLKGNWMLTEEASVSEADNVTLQFNFSAKEVYLVMGADVPSKVLVKLNGNVVSMSDKGDDVDADGYMTVSQSKLYRVIKLPQFTKGQILELTFQKGVKANAFTFGG